MSMVIVGTLAYDTIETPFDRAENALGGSANYIALAANHYTDDIAVVAVVGEDYAASDLALLTERKIDVSGVEIRPGGKTFRWSGRYHHDLNTRDTLETHLNVLADFVPVVPEAYRDAEYVCLGNLAPATQISVLDQMATKPLFSVCDTMNFWMDVALDDLKEVLTRVDCLIINDSEARQLADDPSLIRAATKIRAMGPETLIIKKGEHGALLFVEEQIFSAPAWPLEEVFDPTGAGDTFAGGFLGYIAQKGNTSPETLRSAVVHGSALASFCVERFSLEALRELDRRAVAERVRAFRTLSHFQLEDETVDDDAA